jgi:DNA repair photolyase
MIVRQVRCKTALSPSSLPGLDYSLNPYRGCQHNCAYCYVPNVLHIKRENWGGFVDIKSNIPVVLARELKRKNKGVIGLSTVTDPYQSVEKKYNLSRFCLEQILKYDFPVCIQTKSALVTRDIDIISKFTDSEVMFSIGTLDDTQRKKLEPFSSSINDRLKAMKRIKEGGIKTTVFFGPIYPTIKFEEISDIVDTFVDYGASEIMMDKFNLKPGIWDNVREAFPYHKNLIEDKQFYKEIFFKTLEKCKEKKVKVVNAF